MVKDSPAAIVSAIFVLLFGTIFTGVLLSQLNNLANPQPSVIVNDTAVQEVKNLSEQLAICRQQFNELNNTVVTKQDLSLLVGVIEKINQNVINIYDNSSHYVSTYITITIWISIAVTFSIELTLFTLLDWTLFHFQLTKGFFRVIKRRFNRKEESTSSNSSIS